MVELLIQNEGNLYITPAEGDIVWKTERQGSPGELTFQLPKGILVSEGNAVRLKVDATPVFYGFIFKISEDENTLSVTAYDQIRYLKNKDTYVYENLTATQFIRMLAADFQLQAGEMEDTVYRIPSRVEDNTALIDMIQTALDLTLQNRREMYVLYDDFGRLTLKNIGSMVVGILIDEETAESYTYSTSIDSDTYNQIKLMYENEDTGKREIYIARSTANINRWGILQYFETLQKNENGQAKADALLELYNHKTKNLSLDNVLGDLRVRAGCMIAVRLKLFDMEVNQLMLVEKCSHTFSNGSHLMSLNLRGGDFVA